MCPAVRPAPPVDALQGDFDGTAHILGRMQFDQPKISGALTLSMAFDHGVISVSYKHDPPISLGARLGYRMRPDEARKLAAALTEWADKKP